MEQVGRIYLPQDLLGEYAGLGKETYPDHQDMPIKMVISHHTPTMDFPILMIVVAWLQSPTPYQQQTESMAVF